MGIAAVSHDSPAAAVSQPSCAVSSDAHRRAACTRYDLWIAATDWNTIS